MKYTILQKFSLLNETVLASMSLSSERAIVQQFITAGLSALGADFGFSFIRQLGKQGFKLLYKTPNTPYTAVTPRKNGIVATAFKTNMPQLVSKVTETPGIRKNAHDTMKSVAVIPMIYKGNNYGTIHFCYIKHHEFTKEEQGLVASIGNGAAQAIIIQRLYSNIKDKKEELDDFFDNATMGFKWMGSGGKILKANRAELSMLGYSRAEYIGHNIAEFAVDSSAVSTMLKRLQSHEVVRDFELSLRAKNGFVRTMIIDANALWQDGAFIHSRCFMRDVTERTEAQQKIQHAAFHDTLTNLPNRLFFNERLDAALLEAASKKFMLAVLFFDLDRFKFVNDIFGHSSGDKLLISVGQRLQSALGKKDILCRGGGDEFIVVLSHVLEKASVENMAKKIQKKFREPFHLDGQELYVNASVGISIYPDHGVDMHTLLKNADSALRHAKEHSGNSYVLYSTAMKHSALKHFELETELRRALVNNEFALYYQPQIDSKTGTIVSVEALVRWNHLKLGLVPPADFIGHAEATGLIVPLGEWVLRQACFQNKEWQDAGLPSITMTVNISPRQLLQQRMVETLADILKETELEPKYLELEITEGVIMHNIELSIEILEQFKVMGIWCLVDDFGTGYASLSYLRRLPVSAVKIDQSFVKNCLKNSKDAAIVRAIIAIAHELDFEVVAEGVETKKQQAFLQTQHCDVLQGYFIGKPMPAEAFTKLLKDRMLAKAR